MKRIEILALLSLSLSSCSEYFDKQQSKEKVFFRIKLLC